MGQASINVSRIKLRHLHVLVAVARHGHLTRAAQSLALSQPAISKTLMELEDIVGVALVVRSHRGIALTNEGAMLLQHASTALRTLRQGLDLLSGEHAAAPPTITLGVLPTAAATIVPPAIQLHRMAHPTGRIKVISSHYADLLGRLRRDELDMVLGRQAEPAEMTGLSFEPLYMEEILFVVRKDHPLSGSTAAVALRELHAYPMLLPTEGSIIRRTAEEFLLGAAVLPPEATVESVDPHFSRSYTLRSDAVWVAPCGSAMADLEQGLLVRLPLDTASTRAAVGLTLKAGAELPRETREFTNAIRAAVAARPVSTGTRPAQAAARRRRRP